METGNTEEQLELLRITKDMACIYSMTQSPFKVFKRAFLWTQCSH